MKKVNYLQVKILFSILIGMSLFTQNHATSVSGNINNFFAECQEFKLNGKWITQSLIDLDYQNGDFDNAFNFVITNLVYAENRCFYFNLKDKNDIQDSEMWQNSLQQCKIYDTFFKTIYIDLESKKIMTNTMPDFNFKKCTNFAIVFMQKNKDLYYKFYAFYIDCLTHVFFDFISMIQNNLNNPEEKQQTLIACTKALNKMQYCLTKLQKSKFLKTYKLAINNLRQVLAIAKASSAQDLI